MQGLRAVAVASVVAYHAGLPLPAGFLGVDVFFVISGFVITGLLSREVTATGRLSLGRFYARRARRLLPALCLMLVTVCLASVVLQSALPVSGGQHLTGTTAIGAAVFLANVVLYRVPVDGYFAARATNNPLLHTWSLAVEEQFYLVFPIIVSAVAIYIGVRRRTRTLFGVIAVLSALSLGLSVVFSYGLIDVPGVSAPESLAFYAPFTRAWEFGVGALVALGGSRLRSVPRSWAVVLGLLGAGALVASGVVLPAGAPVPGLVSVIPVVGAALVILAGHAAQPVGWLLSTRPFVAVGDISYSWYLWHWPCIVFAGVLAPSSAGALLVAAAGSLVPAVLAHRLLERPIHDRRRLALVPSRTLALVACSTSVVMGAALVVGAADGWGSEHTRLLGSTLSDQTFGQRTGCFHTQALTASDLSSCRVRARGSHGLIVLVGDSHAEALSDGVLSAGKSLGYDVLVVTTAACAFREPPPDETDLCRQQNTVVGDLIGQQEPALLVVSQATTGYVEGASSKGHVASQIEAEIGPVIRSGTKVLMIGDVPFQGANGVPCRYGALIGPQCQESRRDAAHRQGVGLQVEHDVEQDLPELAYWSPYHRLCDAELCHAALRQHVLYQDQEHLNLYGSRLLAGDLTREIRDAMG